MRARTLFFALLLIVGFGTLVLTQNAQAAEAGEYSALYDAEQYELISAMCDSQAAEIAASPDKGQILSICAKAKAAIGGGAPAPSAPVPAPPAPTAPAPPPTPPVDDVFAATPPPPPSAPAPSAPTPSAPTSAPSAPAPPPTTVTSRPSIGMLPSTVNADLFLAPLRAKEYDKVIALCEEHSSDISSHADKDQILAACGNAKIGKFNDGKTMTDLTGGIESLKESLRDRYSVTASFDLGMAQIRTIDTVPKGIEKLDAERAAILEMWEAIVMRHAIENFTPAVSDQIIIWTIGTPGDKTSPGYVDMLIERVIKNEGNIARQRWLAARIRMLSDRYLPIDPRMGESETRRLNLEVVKGWMVDLLEKSYFDNNVLVGMLTYKADRHEEQYDQTDGTDPEFHKALYFYDEARRRAKSNKAMAVLHGKIAYLCSRYRSNNKQRLVEFYQKGYLHATKGIRLMTSVNRRHQEVGKMTYRYEEDNAVVASNLQKAYGSNLTGYIYNLYLLKEYRAVVGMKQKVLDVPFDWPNKTDVLLLFAESASQLASESSKDERAFEKYKEMCLSAASRAFKFVLKKYGGKAPTAYDEDFCKAFNSYWNYLDRFGQLVQARSLENHYGSACPQGATGSGATATDGASE